MASISVRTIDAATAVKAAQAAEEKAKEIGIAVCIAVYDSSSQLKAYLRMDGAPMLARDIAEDKAHTSASFRSPTHGLFDWISKDPPLMAGITQYPRFIVFGGGYPIVEDGELIGSIGISGGHYSQDMECCKAGLAAIGCGAE
ncbi:GlcG/HbpS family heme-binding protein [Ancylobacter pratisalsi]|uniref:Heme-binding protein n=1 Tax=Ancylobacter pratisalsi TaxID=1745854 RepID=A0A6P1YJC5_9HYPH|nr:heme-binding protein [Ancylobacter pratisalsi]QIB33110.1 heme-binding protein [Ancylobacter pratisalsi]